MPPSPHLAAGHPLPSIPVAPLADHNHAVGAPSVQQNPPSAVRYADASRPERVKTATALLEIAKQSLAVVFNPQRRETAVQNIRTLVQQTPALKHNVEKLDSLLNHHSVLHSRSNSGPTAAVTSSSVERLLAGKAFQDVKANAYDDKAFVFNKGVSSEPEQIRLMKATIESADKFAAVTTYGIKPIERGGKVTTTMHGVLAGLAQKQDDPEFNFVFLYNKSVGIQNKVTGGKRTQVSLNPENHKQQQWPQVLDAYNKQIVDEYNKAIKAGKIPGSGVQNVAELGQQSKDALQALVKAGHISGLPITDLKAKVYMVAATPGIGGSHHNKFAINDSGFAATLGASIGNTSKPSWFDSGAVSLSQKLAESQRNYLLDILLPQGKHIGMLTMENGQSGVEVALKSAQTKNLREQMDTTIRGIEIKDPFGQGAERPLNDKLESGLRSSGFLKEGESVQGHQAKIAWIQNKGSNLEPREAKPIKQALEHLFKQAKPGDTLLLRNNAFNATAQKLVAEAISRGVNVRILAPTKTKVHDAALLFKDIQSVKTKVDALPANGKAGKLEIHVFNPTKTLRDAHEFDPGGRPVNDHAKVYALKRQDPSEPSLLLTGTHNLDGQSFKRSHENVMLMESTDTHLTDSLFDEFWDNTPEMNKQDIDLLVTEFKKPLTTPQAQWAQQLQQKEALLQKMGLPNGA
jgi:hypothetical protein